MKSFVHIHIYQPLLNFFSQGLKPQELALCVALGAGIGIFPVIGIATPLLTAISLFKRLNFSAIQLVSYLVAPLQLLLIIPFIRLGEKIMQTPKQEITLTAMISILDRGIMPAIITLRDTMVHAAVAWLIVGPISIYFLFKIITPFFEMINSKINLKS